MRESPSSARRRRSRAEVVTAFLALALFPGLGCRSKPGLAPWSSRASAEEAAGYAIQVGVFASEENAVRLTRALEGRGLDAFFFSHESGFFKVQVGSFTTRAAAEKTARGLLADGAIDEYFVVMRRPTPVLPSTGPPRPAEEALRAGLVETARSFLDYPYAWGGTTAEKGFDCSGLAMTVYRLNGITLPRSIGEQIKAGRPVGPDALEPGDLVFFSARSRGAASHVGIYIGGGRFIHAPGRGKTIRTEAMSAAYFAARFVEARSYL